MTKEHKHLNLSECHELKYHLTKNNKKTTEDNIEVLKAILEIEKIQLDKPTLTHEDIDNVICELNDTLEDKEKK
ncbi:MAG: hypothetical protein ACRC0S_04945 [Fusobacteriaceae bacterium]